MKFRGFIAIDIEIMPKLVQLENEIKNTGANVKLVEPKNIHITLKFLGDTEEAQINEIEEIMKKSVEESNPFSIKFRNVGIFPNDRYIKVIWIGVENGEQIGIIADKIDKHISKLGFESEKRKFSPHLTIARVRSARNKEKILQIIEKYRDFEFADMNIESIKLKKSELTPDGPIYTTLREVKL